MTQSNTDKQNTNTTKNETNGNKSETNRSQSEAASAEQPATKKTKTAHSEPKKGRSTWVVLIIVSGLATAVYWYVSQSVADWQFKYQALSNQLQELHTATTQQLTDLDSALHQTRENVRIITTQQQQSIQSLQQALQEQQGRRPNDWLIAEVHYLVNLAGRKLWLEHDPTTAVRLLFSADARIAELNDPSLTPVRQALANDITLLKTISPVDQTGIVLQLTSLQKEVLHLPLPEYLLAAESDAEQETAPSTSVKDWKHNLIINLKRFGSEIISYQRIDQNQRPLLPPKQRFFLQENLKQQFSIASQACLQRNQVLYDSALDTAQDWINEFFANGTTQAQAMLASIDKLREQKVSADYPRQLESQTAIDHLVHQRLNESLMPAQIQPSEQPDRPVAIPKSTGKTTQDSSEQNTAQTDSEDPAI